MTRPFGADFENKEKSDLNSTRAYYRWEKKTHDTRKNGLGSPTAFCYLPAFGDEECPVDEGKQNVTKDRKVALGAENPKPASAQHAFTNALDQK